MNSGANELATLLMVYDKMANSGTMPEEAKKARVVINAILDEFINNIEKKAEKTTEEA